MNKISLDLLSAARFQELVRTTFRAIPDSDIAVELKLVSVTDSSPRTVTNGSGEALTFENFSLLFDGPANRPLGQGIYRLEHERLGSFDLFIVPVSGECGTLQYEAVFNRRAAG